MVWISRLLAVALVALMADATIATVHGTFLSLAACGIGAALGVVALALLWPRPWIAAAVAAFLLTAAFAAGSLGGVEHGPAFTAVAPGDAAALVFAILLAAGAAAACVALRSTRARSIIAVLALYALATTLAAFGHGGLIEAFRSAPLAWLRGPYVAAEILLPLAAVVALIDSIRQFARRRPAHGSAAFITAGALVAATQLGAFAAGAAGLPTIVAFESVPAAPAERLPSVAEASAPAGADTASGSLFRPQGSSDVPAAPAAAGTRIAGDPRRALETVVALGDDLYAGALAGSAGALRGGSANSVDKALLLHDLLRAGAPSVETAFARCTLSPEQADAVVARARAGKAHPKIILQQAGQASGGAADPAVRATLVRWAQTWKQLVAQTQEDGRKLGASLQTAGLALPSGQPTQDRLRAVAADHVWIRARIDGKWTDLDPTIAPATLGQTRCAPQTQTATLPDELYDVLGVRVAVEEQHGGGQARTVVFDRTLRTADVGDRDVSFMFAEPVGMDAALPAGPAAAVGVLRLTPLLRVGAENITGTAIDVPTPATDASIGSGMAKGLGAAVSALDSGAPSPTPTPPASTIVSGVWLELSVTAPGSDKTTVQSPIFDRVGFVARAAQASPPAPSSAQLEPANYRATQTLWNIAVSAGHAATAGGAPGPADGGEVPALSRALAQLNGAYFALRRALMDDARGTGVSVAAAQPGISLLAMTNNGDLAMDVASDSAVPLTTDEARPTWAAAAVLAERVVVNGESLVSGGGTGPAGGNDALTAIERAAAGDAHLVALRPSDQAPPPTAVIPDEARARVTARLAKGASVLAPAPQIAEVNGPTYAYWVVDPSNGTLRDENTFGRHQTMPERAEVQEEVAVKPQSAYRRLACRTGRVASGVAFAIMVWSTQDSSKAEGKAFEDAVEEAEKADNKTPGCGL